MGTSIGDYTVQDGDKEKLGQNYDLLADMNTSYGAPQVMGLYAQQGKLKANNSDEAELRLIEVESGKVSSVDERMPPMTKLKTMPGPA